MGQAKDILQRPAGAHLPRRGEVLLQEVDAEQRHVRALVEADLRGEVRGALHPEAVVAHHLRAGVTRDTAEDQDAQNTRRATSNAIRYGVKYVGVGECREIDVLPRGCKILSERPEVSCSLLKASQSV